MMATWKVTPEWKKSVIETQHWSKEGVAGYITYQIAWRFGEFFVESDNEPEIDDSTNLLELSEDWSTEDGCWEEAEYDLADPAIEEEVRTIVEEGSIFDLEEHGWVMDECEITIQDGALVEQV